MKLGPFASFKELQERAQEIDDLDKRKEGRFVGNMGGAMRQAKEERLAARLELRERLNRYKR